jgi:hypothetical protein
VHATWKASVCVFPQAKLGEDRGTTADGFGGISLKEVDERSEVTL